MSFDKYTLSDFLMDESFHDWVKNSNSNDGSFWESWLKDHPEKQEDADQAKAILSSISFKNQTFDREEISELWAGIKEKTVEETSTKRRGKQQFLWNYVKVAAVMLPFIIAAVLLLFYRDTGETELVEVQSELIQKINPKGQKLTTFLSDGTKVILNAESSISFFNPLDEKRRIVTLEGEAFFDVAHDPSRPFIVRTGSIETKVLGTSFNVKAYPEEAVIKVAVKSGMVTVENTNLKSQNNQNRSIVLSPSEMATYTEADNKTRVTEFDPMEIAWSEGIFHLDNASMEEFVKAAERWYGTGFVLQRNKPIAKGITGNYRDTSLEKILMGHKDASEFEYEFLPDGRVLIK